MTDEQLAELAIDERNEYLGEPLVYVPGVGWVGEAKEAQDEARAELLFQYQMEALI
jgi:hypothetical protein